MKRRAYTAPPYAQRCKNDITLRDGSGAQCMRRAVIGDLCMQHARMAAERQPQPDAPGVQQVPRG